MDRADKEALLQFLQEMALEAGARILQLRQSVASVTIKGDGSPVTQADREAEALILAALQRHAGGIGVVSEENQASHKKPPSRQFFLVDALDGTKEFVRRNGKGAFTVNIALIEESVPVMGVVHAPALGRLFGGIAGVGAWEGSGAQRRALLGGAARRSAEAGEEGLLAVTSRSHGDARSKRWLAQHGVRREVLLGSSLKFCLVACGEADVYPRFGPTMEWDTAAGDAVLRAAGGAVLDLDGNALRYGKEGYRNSGFVAWGAGNAGSAGDVAATTNPPPPTLCAPPENIPAPGERRNKSQPHE